MEGSELESAAETTQALEALEALASPVLCVLLPAPSVFQLCALYFTRFRPLPFALYNAVSADLKRFSTESIPREGYVATPILPVM